MIEGMRRLFDALKALGLVKDTLAGSGELFVVLGEVFVVLRDVVAADTLPKQFALAVRVLRIVAPRTETKLDDGGLLALEAMGRDEAFQLWLEQQAVGASLMPEGAIACQVAPSEVPSNAAALTAGGVTQASFVAWIPLILQLIDAIRALRRGE